MRETLVQALFGLLLAAGLAGCVDARLEVAITGDTTAKATLSQDMRPDSFTAVSLADTLGESAWQAAVKATGEATLARKEAEAAGKDASAIVVPPLPPFYQSLAASFCNSGGLLKRVDGGANCIEVSEGDFADIALGPLQQPLTFTPEDDGLVRVALPTQQLLDAVQPNLVLNAEIETIIPALFAGRRITIRFSGAEVVETNMTLAKDGLSASQELAILDLLSGKAELPEEFYAVVRAP